MNSTIDAIEKLKQTWLEEAEAAKESVQRAAGSAQATAFLTAREVLCRQFVVDLERLLEKLSASDDSAASAQAAQKARADSLEAENRALRADLETMRLRAKSLAERIRELRELEETQSYCELCGQSVASTSRHPLRPECERAVAEMGSAVLCYVKGPWAYFTTQSLDEQWGDGWGKAPYEYNAGPPYRYSSADARRGRTPWEIYTIAREGPFETPRELHYRNSPFSVWDINTRQVAWLKTECWCTQSVTIFAGIPLRVFVQLVREAGGEVYLPMQGNDSRRLKKDRTQMDDDINSFDGR